MINKLYGDGIHDDFPAIQEMLDSRACVVALPAPKKNYLIGKTLKIHSNQELRLERYARICLADNSNCLMVTNAEPENWNEKISLVGGIWDMNHKNQDPNPFHFPSKITGKTSKEYMSTFDRSKRDFPHIYTGFCIAFLSVKELHISDVTIKNPVAFGIDLSYVEDFTVENIKFDYNEGSPKLWNLDGVHIEGYCKNGVLRNLKGACHDDLVAITSDDLIYGPIENISVDGVFAEGCHSAVRLLSMNNPVRNININNIYGKYYVYCITMSRYYEGEGKSKFENINISNVFASLCEGTVDVPGNYEPFISIGNGMDIKKITFSNIYRNETHCPLPTIGIKGGTKIDELCVYNSEQTNETGKPCSFIENEGTIGNLVLFRVNANGDEILTGNGKTENNIRV